MDKANRQFRVPAPNMLWVSDFTYVATWKGFVYVAFVMDAWARKIAAFLDIAPSNWQTVLDHCTFDYMKAHAGDCVPLGGAFWEGGAQTFLHKGTNGRWQGVLPEADSAALEAGMQKELGADCAAWMQSGTKI